MTPTRLDVTTMSTTPTGTCLLGKLLVADTWARSGLLGYWATVTIPIFNDFCTYLVLPLLRGSYVSFSVFVLGAPVLVVLALCFLGEFCLFLFLLFFLVGSTSTISYPYQCPSFKGQEQNQ